MGEGWKKLRERDEVRDEGRTRTSKSPINDCKKHLPPVCVCMQKEETTSHEIMQMDFHSFLLKHSSTQDTSH